MSHAQIKTQKPPRLIAGLAGLFGLMTTISGGMVLFGPGAVRDAAGQVVPFVLWFNTAAGVAYLLTAIAIWRGHPRAATFAWLIAIATALVGAGFVVVALGGASVEPRTAGALVLRTGVWAGIAIWLTRRTNA